LALILENHLTTVFSAAAAWEFSRDLGNLGINLGFREFSKQSWQFWYIQAQLHEIFVIPNLQRLTSLLFIRYLTALCHVSAISAFTYLLQSYLKHCSYLEHVIVAI